MKRLALLILILIPISLLSQTKYVLKGVVINKSGQKINDARIIHNDYTVEYTKHGVFHVEIKSENDSISIIHIAYKKYSFNPKKKWSKKAKGDTLLKYFKLEEEYNETEAIEIVAEYKPKEVFGNDSIGVEDFEIIGDKLVILGTTKSLKKESNLYLTDQFQNILSEIKLDDVAIKFETDYRDEVHIICKNNVFHLNVQDNRLKLDSVNRQYYDHFLSPIIDTIGINFFTSDYNRIYPAVEYRTYQLNGLTSSIIRKIEDKHMMDLYRAEYRWADSRVKLWAIRMEDRTGIDKEIWVGSMYFTRNLFYQPVCAPLFKKNDSLFIFDHHDNQLLKYNVDSGFVDSVQISYHLYSAKKSWKRNLLQDSNTEEIYGHFENAGYTYLKKINTNNGKISSSDKLFYKYVEKIKIIDGFVYYIYRPFESTQEKYIYRESLSHKLIN